MADKKYRCQTKVEPFLIPYTWHQASDAPYSHVRYSRLLDPSQSQRYIDFREFSADRWHWRSPSTNQHKQGSESFASVRSGIMRTMRARQPNRRMQRGCSAGGRCGNVFTWPGPLSRKEHKDVEGSWMKSWLELDRHAQNPINNRTNCCNQVFQSSCPSRVDSRVRGHLVTDGSGNGLHDMKTAEIRVLFPYCLINLPHTMRFITMATELTELYHCGTIVWTLFTKITLVTFYKQKQHIRFGSTAW